MFDIGNKVGRCPSSTGFGICVMGCFADSDCQGVKKCCSNGCGRTCQTPSFVREGECPSNEGVVGICAINENSCLDDEQCDAGHKCCARGCNNECVRV